MSAPFGLLNGQPVFGPVSAAPEIAYWDPPTYGITTVGEIWFNGWGPTYAVNPWDVVVIAGLKIPGICKVHGLPTLAFDKKKKGGVDGATITVNGYIPGPIEVEIKIWTQDQWSVMQAVAAQLWRRPNKKQKAADIAVTIDHPAFALWGINAVIIVGVSVPEDGPIPQSKLIKIKCVEYVPTTNTNRTKTAKAPVVIPEDNRQPASTALADDPPSVTDLGPNGPGQPTTPGG